MSRPFGCGYSLDDAFAPTLKTVPPVAVIDTKQEKVKTPKSKKKKASSSRRRRRRSPSSSSSDESCSSSSDSEVEVVTEAACVDKTPLFFTPNTTTERGEFGIFSGSNAGWLLPPTVTAPTLGPPGPCIPQNPWPDPRQTGPAPYYNLNDDSRLTASAGQVPIGDLAGTFTDPNTGQVYAAYTQAMPAPKILREPPVFKLGEPNRMLESLTGVSTIVKPCRQEIVNDFQDAIETAQFPDALLSLRVEDETAQRNARELFFTNRETEAGYNDTHWDGYIGTTFVMRPTFDTQTLQDNNETNTTVMPFRPIPDGNLAIPMFTDGTEFGGPMQPTVNLLAQDKVKGYANVVPSFDYEGSHNISTVRDSGYMGIEGVYNRKADMGAPQNWEVTATNMLNVQDRHTVDRERVQSAVAMKPDAQMPYLNMQNLLAATDSNKTGDSMHVARVNVHHTTNNEHIQSLPVHVADSIGREELFSTGNARPVAETQDHIRQNVPSHVQLSAYGEMPTSSRAQHADINLPAMVTNGTFGAQLSSRGEEVHHARANYLDDTYVSPPHLRDIVSTGLSRNEEVLTRVLTSDSEVHARQSMPVYTESSGSDSKLNHMRSHVASFPDVTPHQPAPTTSTATDSVLAATPYHGTDMSNMVSNATMISRADDMGYDTNYTARISNHQTDYDYSLHHALHTEKTATHDSNAVQHISNVAHHMYDVDPIPMVHRDSPGVEKISAPGRVSNSRVLAHTNQAAGDVSMPTHFQLNHNADGLFAAYTNNEQERLLRNAFLKNRPEYESKAAEFRNGHSHDTGRRADECDPYKHRDPTKTHLINALLNKQQLYRREERESANLSYDSDV